MLKGGVTMLNYHVTQHFSVDNILASFSFVLIFRPTTSLFWFKQQAVV